MEEEIDSKLIGEATVKELLTAVASRCSVVVLYVISSADQPNSVTHYRHVSGDQTMALGMLEYLRILASRGVKEEA